MKRPPRYRQRPARVRRNRKKPNWLKIILGTLCLLAVGQTTYLAFTSPKLRVQRVEVRGNRTIPVGEIRSYADSAIGSNIFLADTRSVRKKVLRNPVVRDAKVRKWPANRIIIRVGERTPAAVILHKTKSYLTDDDSFIYATVDEPGASLPVIEIPDSIELKIASRKRVRPVRLAMSCIKQAEENDLTVGKISVDPRNNICLNMSSGLEVRLGPAIDVEKKLSILQGVLAARPDFANDAVYLDLSCTSAPAWKSKDPNSFP